jgi:hypothetical protein
MHFPDRTAEIEIHREAARQLRARGDHSGARSSYLKWVESVRQQNVNMGGRLEPELENAKREYSEFVKTDPLYQQIRGAALERITENPGILQTELYTKLPEFDKAAVQYAVYFMEDHGFIVRTRKGRTYSLSLR